MYVCMSVEWNIATELNMIKHIELNPSRNKVQNQVYLNAPPLKV